MAVLDQGVRFYHRNLILPVGAHAVAILGLAHSIIDFSLQILGYVIVVFSWVGAGLAQSYTSNKIKSNYNKLGKHLLRGK